MVDDDDVCEAEAAEAEHSEEGAEARINQTMHCNCLNRMSLPSSKGEQGS